MSEKHFISQEYFKLEKFFLVHVRAKYFTSWEYLPLQEYFMKCGMKYSYKNFTCERSLSYATYALRIRMKESSNFWG